MRKARQKIRRVGWYKVALEAIERLARRQRFMTSDDVWAELGDVQAPSQNAMGAVMKEAGDLKIIRSTGRVIHSTRGPRRGGNILIHESCLYREVESIEDYVTRHDDGAQGSLGLGA